MAQNSIHNSISKTFHHFNSSLSSQFDCLFINSVWAFFKSFFNNYISFWMCGLSTVAPCAATVSADRVLWMFTSSWIHHCFLSGVTNLLLFSDCLVISWHSGAGHRDLWGSPTAVKCWNDKIITTSVLCPVVLTQHYRYQIVCVVKCVLKTPQAYDS